MRILFILLCIFSLSFGAGPNKIAKSNRSLWAYKIDSKESFNFASKMEILAFIKELQKIEFDNDLEAFTGLKEIDLESISKYLERIKAKLLLNYRTAALEKEHLSNDFLVELGNARNYDELKNIANIAFEILPHELREWAKNAESFYQNYIYEQIRLAALFPKITSEILPLSDDEITGYELESGKFILSFDDGPSKNANTKNITNFLRERNIGAIFFVLDSSLKNQNIDFKKLYSGFAVGFHGFIHKPHTKKEIWENVPQYTKNIVLSGNSKNCYFRPPQRTMELVESLKDINCKIMLWNIDSLDWSPKISADEVLDRIITLSLLYRSGIILFHDIHPKAFKILPKYIEFINKSGLEIIMPH